MATSSSWWQLPLVSQSLAAVVGAGAIVLVVKLIQATLIRRLTDPDSRYYARKLVTLGGWLAVALLITVVFRDRLGGLPVAIGVASAGIAFALQEVIGSIAGWIAISFGNFYSPGDRVQLGGIRGDVIDIGILRTTLMELGEWVASDLYTGRVVRIANSFVFKEPVFNYSGDFPFLWDEVRIPVQHGCDHRLARQLLEEVLQEVCSEDLIRDSRQAWQRLVRRYLLENASLEPAVSLVITDNWMEFTLRYLVDYKRRRSTRDRLSMRVLDAFADSGGAVALGSATLQLVEPDPLEVRLQRD
ncbi:mechanosensitive ion channel family protein [Synechococcus sp. CBW1004]|uniref:mechanosensitive ion channel family protein n=1 Tax=Synechococcus sp. CBW1004 TaxID=1353136 RepID=UPI0018CF7E0D|nr:mechanosensitive ion channel domain-containing protein [Synechococcus sp. CBW1004]QPN65204.1 mechanosensitive ion channel [Synechococcus sp. CBW1004]